MKDWLYKIRAKSDAMMNNFRAWIVQYNLERLIVKLFLRFWNCAIQSDIVEENGFSLVGCKLWEAGQRRNEEEKKKKRERKMEKFGFKFQNVMITFFLISSVCKYVFLVLVPLTRPIAISSFYSWILTALMERRSRVRVVHH